MLKCHVELCVRQASSSDVVVMILMIIRTAAVVVCITTISQYHSFRHFNFGYYQHHHILLCSRFHHLITMQITNNCCATLTSQKFGEVEAMPYQRQDSVQRHCYVNPATCRYISDTKRNTLCSSSNINKDKATGTYTEGFL